MIRKILFLASLPMIAAPFVSMGASSAAVAQHLSGTLLSSSNNEAVLVADSYRNYDRDRYDNRDNSHDSYRNYDHDRYHNRDNSQYHNTEYYRSWYNNNYRSYNDGYTYDWYRNHYQGNRDQYYSWFYNRYNNYNRR